MGVIQVCSNKIPGDIQVSDLRAIMALLFEIITPFDVDLY
jgi:hypothetical protein